MQQRLIDRIEVLYKEKTKRHRKREEGPNLNERLRNLLRDAIINNDLPKGTVLPPTRRLAERLELSRSTVIKAYDLLKLEGYVEARQGSGYVVKDLNADPEPLDTETHKHHYADVSAIAKSFSKNVQLINSTDDQSIAFRPGLPPLDIFPVNNWKNLSNGYWRYIKSSALTYSPSAGIDMLKQNIANYLNLSRHIKCDPRQILIVSGSLQSLYLVGSVLLDPNDATIVEDPTFPNVKSIFDGLRASVKGVPVDEDGISVTTMQQLDVQPKLIHVTPSSHYPKGIRMSVDRRKELLRYASEKGAYIIENDYEHEVHNHRDPVAPIFNIDDQNRTIYMSTFNRLLHPSIRIGFMIVPPQLLDATEALMKHSHRFVPPSVQVVLNEFIEKNYLQKHVRNVIRVAQEREEVFADRFNEVLEGPFELQPHQTPSLHLVAKINGKESDRELVDLFAKNNIIVHSLSKCHVSNNAEQGLILGYSSVRPPVIRKKLEDMQKIYRSWKRKQI